MTYTLEDVNLLLAAHRAAVFAPANYDEAQKDFYFNRTRETFLAWQTARDLWINQPLTVSAGDTHDVRQKEGQIASVLQATADGKDDPRHASAQDTFASDVAAVGSDQSEAGPQTGETVSTSAGTLDAELSAHADNRKPGAVSFYSASQQYGYITSQGENFYFQTRNLKYVKAPIMTGDTVTFEAKHASGEHAGMPKALLILVDGYTPPARTPRPGITEAQAKARQSEANRKARLAQNKAHEKARRERNRPSIQQTLGRE